MTSKPATADADPVLDHDPEPIEAEFEPTGGQKAAGRAPPRRRSAVVTHRDLLIASCVSAAVSALLGAVIAIAATSTGSGASTGTLAQEIDAIRASEAQLTASAEQVSSDIVALRSRLDTQADRIGQREAGEADVRTELAAINAQLSALIGAGDGKAQAGASSSTSPLGVLISRLNRLETLVEDDASGPKTTRQVQRSLADLEAQVKLLAEAQAQYTSTVSKRQMSFDALENGLEKLTSDLASLRVQVAQLSTQRARVAAAPAAPTPLFAGAAESRTIRAFSALEAAARNGQAFEVQQQALAALMPKDEDVASLQGLAQSGAPTLDVLRRDFAAAARAAQSVASAPQDDGWSWLRSGIAGVGALQRSNVAESTASLILEARRSLEAGDTRAAIEAVQDMDLAPAAAFTQWRTAATLRADLDARLAAINAKLAAQTTPTRNAG